MSFVSFSFLFLICLVVPLFYILPHKLRWVLLLAASWFFYAYFNVYLIFLLLFTTAVSYFSALMIEKNQSKKVKKTWLIIAIIACLGSLFFFKYAQFTLDSMFSLCNLFGAKLTFIELNIILPVGISFYTFQTLSYVIDVYNKRITAERHFGYYALFISFFPQLVAGPIEKASNLLPQLKAEHKFEWQQFKEGAITMLGGFIKKIAVADVIVFIPDAIFNSTNLNSLTAVAVIVACALFVVQVYCDFSGYSDIAIGCAQMLGVKLMKNFDRPFNGQTVTDFWSRWHMSLAAWFNEYIYLPLAYKTFRKKNQLFWHSARTLFVMFLCGLWHGADWKYVIWGLIFGVLLVIESVLRQVFKEKKKKEKSSWLVSHLKMCRTFVIVMFPMVFARANSVGDAFTLLSRVFCGWGASLEYFSTVVSQLQLSVESVIIVLLSLVLLSFIDSHISTVRGKITNDRNPALQNTLAILMVWVIILAWCMIIINGQGTNGFVYFQF